MAETIVEELKILGLSAYEAKTLLAIIENPESTAEEIASLANVPKAKIYTVLKSLEKRGVIKTSQTRPKRYMALPAQEIIETMVEQKKKEVNIVKKTGEKLAKKLSKTTTGKREETKVWRIWGERAVINEAINMMRQAKRTVDILINSEQWLKDMNTPKAIQLTKYNSKRKIKSRIVLTMSLEIDPKDLSEDALKYYSSKHINFRVIPPERVLNCMLIVDGKMAGIPVIDPETKMITGGIVVIGKELCMNYTEYFEKVWASAYPVEEKVRKMLLKELEKRRKKEGGRK